MSACALCAQALIYYAGRCLRGGGALGRQSYEVHRMCQVGNFSPPFLSSFMLRQILRQSPRRSVVYQARCSVALHYDAATREEITTTGIR